MTQAQAQAQTQAPPSTAKAQLANRPKRKRVSFEFSEESLAALDRLTVKTNSATKGETVRRALSLLEAWIKKTEQGYEVAYKKGDETQVVQMVF